MKHSWKRFWQAIAGSLFFCLMGFGMRYAEDSQVGYTHDTSTWIFAISALLAYYAGITCFILLKTKKPPQ